MSKLRLRSDRRKTTGKYQGRARQRRSLRRLSAETLERRLLLTTITGVDPAAFSADASVGTNVTATFDQDVVAGTATAENFVVRGSTVTGVLSSSDATVSAAGPTITHNPNSSFSPGEVVQVTATDGIATTGGAANPRVWQFRTATRGGTAEFTDGGVAFGSDSLRHIALGDVDGDGDLDALRDGNQLWINDGSGTFTDSGQSIGAGLAELVFSDLDGDGDIDIAGGQVMLNDGTGNFTASTNLGGSSSVRTGDLDGDGDLDIVEGVQYGSSEVWLNNGNGSFTNTGQALVGGQTDAFELGDIDNDGDLDAIEAVAGGPNRIWTNDGSANFTQSGTFGGFFATKDLDVGDIDADGDLDIVAGHVYQGTGARVYLNDGSGVFTNSGQVIGGGTGQIYRVRIGDMDSDGDLDIIAFQRLNGGTEIWLNDGAGTFSDTGQRLMFTGDRRIDFADVGDIDGDGDLDLVEANIRATGPGSRIWFNNNADPGLSVTLSVDNATIDETAGVATVTATLSAVHTDPVTVELETAGTATEGEDYTISATEIVIAAGATTGTVIVTATDDTADEPDESVIISIADVTNAAEEGDQEVTSTILDNDEPVPVPDVTLTVDNSAIDENGGVANFTATLSEITTVPVTIDLAISGTAGASDFIASDTQIVVAPGATTGAISVTATDDDLDEPGETVVVDIDSVTGGTEAGVQQQTTTITDDDEPVMPNVTLSVDDADIEEEGGVATLTVTLSEATTAAVTVELGIRGTAEASDFVASATEVVIAPGETTGTLTVTAVGDELSEPDETVIVEVTNVTGGNEDGEQQQTITIIDNDAPPSFAVTSLTASVSGFHLEFTNPIDSSEINLYDTQNAGMGAADLVVTGATTGAVVGSVITGESSLTFIRSGDPLAADTYTVTLRSGEDGFKDDAGALLDGDGDGTGGDDYTGSFEVAEPAANTVTVSVPDFTRGSGQPINLPADTSNGIPITISDGENVRAIDLRVGFDPTKLTISGATVGADAPAGATVIVNTTTPGLAIVVFFSPTALSSGNATVIQLQAEIPPADVSSVYGTQHVLDLHDVTISDGNDNERPVLVDDAFHLVSYFADVSGNGRINASDAAQVARFAALIDTGFSGSLLSDPILVGDVSGNGRVNAADASLVAQFAALIAVPQIPPIPGGVLATGLAGGDLGAGLPSGIVLPQPPDAVSVEPPVDDSSDSAGEAAPQSGHLIPLAAVDLAMAELADSGTRNDRDGSQTTLEDAIQELFSFDL